MLDLIISYQLLIIPALIALIGTAITEGLN
jgi:hypothetical protein